MAVFAIYHPDRAAPVKIPGTFATIEVFLKAALDIGSDTGVKRRIAGFDYV